MSRCVRAILIACVAGLCLARLPAAETVVFIHDYYFAPTNVTSTLPYSIQERKSGLASCTPCESP